MSSNEEGDKVRPYPLITQAIRTGDVNETIALLDRYPEMRDFDVPAFGTWLHFACWGGTLAVVQALATLGFDPHSTANRDHRAPIAMAAQQGNAEIVRWLIERGAALDTSDAIRNPLFGAALACSPEIAGMLLDAGIDTTARYRMSSSDETVDAIAFAMLHGARDVARRIAMQDNHADETVEAALKEGLRIAEAITQPSPEVERRSFL